MKYTYIKCLEYKDGVINEKQLKAKIIEHKEYYVIAEYILKGVKETIAIQNEDLRESPHIIKYAN